VAKVSRWFGIDIHILNLRRLLGTLASKYGVSRLGFEKDSVTFGFYDKLARSGPKAQLIPTAGIVEALRYVKDQREIQLIAKAARIADEAFNHIIEILKTGMEERDIEIELEYFMKKAGAQAAGFPTIIAIRPEIFLASRCSVPAQDRVRRSRNNGFWGTVRRLQVRYDQNRGNGQDQRHTEGDLRDCEERPGGGVLSSQSRVKGTEPDRAARSVIEDAGFGEFFGHGVGHGVGLEIHEEPFMTPHVREDALKRAMSSQ